MVMNREDMMARMPSTPAEETPAESMFDTSRIMDNVQAMPEEEKSMLSELLQDPIVELLDSVLGEPVMAQVSEQVKTAEAEPTPTADEGIMGRPEDQISMEDAEESPEATPMAKGGMMNTQMKDMVRQGMSPQEIRNKLR